MASDSRSPAVPAGGPSRAPRVRAASTRRASGPGSGAESPSSRETGRGRRGRPLARHAPHVRGEPGAKPFVDDLLLGRGFVRSRAAPSLRSIESQPSTQGFVPSRGGGRSVPFRFASLGSASARAPRPGVGAVGGSRAPARRPASSAAGSGRPSRPGASPVGDRAEPRAPPVPEPAPPRLAFPPRAPPVGTSVLPVWDGVGERRAGRG